MVHWRNLVCWPLIAGLPLSLAADDTGAAILHSRGAVLLNKNPVPSTSAVLAGDLVETQNDAVARIEQPGSAADINSETVIQFNSDELILEHGSLSVNTSRGLKVQAGCVAVTPVRIEWTHYEVRDTDGQVTVSASKGDVYMESRSVSVRPAKASIRSDRVTVSEGQQRSREDKCGGSLKQGAPAAAHGAIMNSPYVQVPALGVVVGVACWTFCFGVESISPDRP